MNNTGDKETDTLLDNLMLALCKVLSHDKARGVLMERLNIFEQHYKIALTNEIGDILKSFASNREPIAEQ
jgi:hypothetical protein